MDERICPSHDGGRHCWHPTDRDGFKGKWERVRPVKCCHCNATAKQRLHGADFIDEFRPPDNVS